MCLHTLPQFFHRSQLKQTDAQREAQLKQKAVLNRQLRSGRPWDASDRSGMPAARFVYWITSRPLSYFCALLLLIAGAFLESEGYVSDALARSGAVLVAFALVVLWLWVHYSKAAQTSKSLLDNLKVYLNNQSPPNLAHVANKIQRLHPNMPVDIRAAHLFLVYDRLSNGPENHLLLSTYSDRLAVVQVELALIGTLVWAFGDLLPI